MARADLDELYPPCSDRIRGFSLSDAGANGFATVAGGDVGHGESYHREERSAEVAEYEECANPAPRQNSARMPKRRGKL